MIQRKQSIWFLVAAIGLLLTYIVPFATTTINHQTYEIFAFQFQSSEPALNITLPSIWIAGIGYWVVGILMLINIFLFNNRKLQKNIARLGCILILLATVYWAYQTQTFGLETFKVGIAVPAIAIFFIFLGISGINQDIKLLKSADRLR